MKMPRKGQTRGSYVLEFMDDEDNIKEYPSSMERYRMANYLYNTHNIGNNVSKYSKAM